MRAKLYERIQENITVGPKCSCLN